VSSLREVLSTARIVVCCGSGGVGKTTVSAATGIAAARLGRRVVVVTIDPAKRLADALGTGPLGNEPTAVPLDAASSATGGSLDAAMLDTKATFDAVVRRYAPDQARADRILANGLYRNISSALSGTQEYMAAEKVHELIDAARWDLVVIDTPPSRHAVDFLTAPRRLTRFLDNAVFRALMASGRGSMRVLGVAAQTVLRPITSVVGGRVVDDAIEFFRAFDGMEAGFRARATEVLDLLASPGAAWVVVTAARPEPVEDATWLVAALRENGIAPAALVVNRVQADVPVPDSLVGTPIGALLTELAELRSAQFAVLSGLRTTMAAHGRPGAPEVLLAERDDDVNDLAALGELGDALVAENRG
jgi:anion-transporting  ArsA/GET3 family ATPase